MRFLTYNHQNGSVLPQHEQLCHKDGGFWLDGVKIGDACRKCTNYGLITAAQLLPDTVHTVDVNDFGVLAIVYRVP